MLHEFTHVIQYETLGFAAFGTRYAAELHAQGYDAGSLYRYEKRNRSYSNETLEGQAEIVGDYALNSRLNTPAARLLVQRLRAKLSGSGIYGH